MDADTIATDRINALHGVRDAAKLSALVASMRAEGWQGRPLLGELGSDGYTVHLWTGSHRYAAAVAAGLDEIDVLLVDADALIASGHEPQAERRGGVETLRNAMPEDDAAILAILRAADPEAAELFATELTE